MNRRSSTANTPNQSLSGATTSQKQKEIGKWKDIPHKDQIFILVLARVVEPVVQTSLTAYMFHQLQWFDSSLPDSTISWQAGVLQASFSGAQTLTSWYWGRAADLYGRKAVLLFGSFGTLISCIGFGLSTSFLSALIFRILGGLVNGNIPVMRTMVSEIVKEKKHQARAFLLMPMCFNIGVIIGPAMGGLLANPAGTYPGVFGPGSSLGGQNGVWWMVKFPYLTPNLFSSLVVVINIFLVSIFLSETRPSSLYFRQKLYGRMKCQFQRIFGRNVSTQNEGSDLQDSEQGVPLLDPEVPQPEPKPQPPRLPFHRIWTPNVLCTLFAHFTTAFHIGTFNNLAFIFLSTERYFPNSPSFRSNYHPHGPFVFTGGLNLSSVQVGTAMSILGAIGITFQVLIYPRMNDKYGVLPLYRLFVYGFPIAYLLTPYLALIPTSSPPPKPADGILFWFVLCAVFCIYTTSRVFVLPATMILVNNCSPHPSVLGTVHGVAGSVGSAARTLGPGVAGYLFGVGLDLGVVGLAWWALAVAAGVAVLASWLVTEGSGHEILLDGEQRTEEVVPAASNQR